MSPKQMRISRAASRELPLLRAIGKWEISRATVDWRTFDAIYLINLPERTDRKRELERELRRVSLHPADPRLAWIRAVRPTEPGEFPSIGARGCFLSHLACLRSSYEGGHKRILILEDDAHFPKPRVNELKQTLEKLRDVTWDIWYGGGTLCGDLSARRPDAGMNPISAGIGVQTSHCIALQRNAIEALMSFFELILTRPNGHPEAGPMHVDGAYSTWRFLNPTAITLATLPPVCIQRSSHSDISIPRWFDRTPLIRNGSATLRRLRNHLIR